MQNPRVVVLVSNYNGKTVMYNGKSILDLCLTSLKKTKYPDFKILIGDGCSTDDSVNYVKTKFPQFSLITDKTNVGLARSVNEGIRFALDAYKPSYILLLNNDIIIQKPDWIEKLVAVAESDEKIGLVGCKLVYPDGRIQHAGAILGFTARSRGRAESDLGQYDKIEDMEVVTGAVCLIKRQVIEKIGVWDGNFLMGYEDIDYCVRAKKAGFRVIYDGTVKLTHLEGSTSTNSKNKTVRDSMFYTSQRNHTYFALKHFGLSGRMGVFFTELVNCLFTIESKDRVRRLSNIQMKSRPIWRLHMTAKAMLDGYRVYKANKKYRQTNNFLVVRE